VLVGDWSFNLGVGSVGIGYRFNLEDLFGRREAEHVPMK